MASIPEDLMESLVLFREDILKALAGLKVEISALQQAVLESKLISQSRLDELRKEEEERNFERFMNRFAEKIESRSIRI